MTIDTKEMYNGYWLAWDADNYEPGMPLGRGRTEPDAIEDFKAEQAEWEGKER